MKEKKQTQSGREEFPRPKLPKLFFNEEEKRTIIEDYLSSGETMTAIWTKYTGRIDGQFQIKRWMIKYGFEDKRTVKSNIFGTNPNLMGSNDLYSNDDTFETLQLKKRIADLEKQLRDSEMKATAFSTMVDLAEKEFNISIRKKYNTKLSKD